MLITGYSPAPEATGNMAVAEPPTAIIPLLGSTRDVKGIELPEALHGPGVNGYDVTDPCALEILVSGRRSIRLQAVRARILTTDRAGIRSRTRPQGAGAARHGQLSREQWPATAQIERNSPRDASEELAGNNSPD